MSGPVTALLLLSIPSIVKLLLRGRCPPTEGPMPMPIPPLEAPPGLSRDALRTPKPVDPPEDVEGRLLSATLLKVWVRLIVVVSRTAPACAETSTVVLAPIERPTLVVAVLLSSTTIPRSVNG